MTSFRSARLEALLGAAIDPALPYAALTALKANQVPEAVDLEYKKEHYKAGDSDKRALCGDIAAMANAAGGIILLGVEEDAYAAAKNLIRGRRRCRGS